MISLIVGRARNGAIGRDGDIPWHVPEDLKFFQRETMGGAIIMGRKTWESLPFKPLKNRLNVVVSRGEVAGADLSVNSVTAAVNAARAAGHSRIYGIGGAGIYEAMLPIAHRLLITEVDLEIEDADTFFPEFDESGWTIEPGIVLKAEGTRCVMREFLRGG